MLLFNESVGEFLNANIARGVRTQDTDIVGLAKELPDEFKMRVRARCEKM